jgi:hypothetical protein
VTLPERWPRPRRSSSHAADRKRIEMLFAHVKRILRLGRLRLRGAGPRSSSRWQRSHRTPQAHKAGRPPPPIMPTTAVA